MELFKEEFGAISGVSEESQTQCNISGTDDDDHAIKWGEVYANKNMDILLFCAYCKNVSRSTVEFHFHIIEAHNTPFENVIVKNEYEDDVTPSENTEAFIKEEQETSNTNIEIIINENYNDPIMPCEIKEEKDEIDSDENSLCHTSNSTFNDPPKPPNPRANRRKLKDKKVVKPQKVQSSKKKESVLIDAHCELCNTDFSRRDLFKKHALQHETAPADLQKMRKYLKCDICEMNFTDYKVWIQHEIHHGKPPFLCAFCPKRLSTRNSLREHTNIHTGMKPFQCEQCPNAFASYMNLDRHIKRVHLRLLRYSCEFCDRRFFCANEFRNHQKKHAGEKPNQCEICGKSYLLGFALNNHRKTHSETRDVKCPYCPMTFYTKKQLTTHMPKHTKVRRYACETCGEAFSRRTSLRTHRDLHLSEKKYVCKVCDKSFAQSAGLYSHKKTHLTAI